MTFNSTIDIFNDFLPPPIFYPCHNEDDYLNYFLFEFSIIIYI